MKPMDQLNADIIRILDCYYGQQIPSSSIHKAHKEIMQAINDKLAQHLKKTAGARK